MVQDITHILMSCIPPCLISLVNGLWSMASVFAFLSQQHLANSTMVDI